MKRRWLSAPAVVLFVLSPVVGELLSGSAPPAEFFNPLGFVMLAVLYGGGAILIREMTFWREKGWPTVLMFGAAYGIAEEGLMCKSFFDPAWMDLGPLGHYGRWLGVNWVWAAELTIYHAVFSIAIPIVLVSIIFPKRRSEAWISRPTFVGLSGLWGVNAALIFFFISKYRPPVAHYVLTLVITAGLCVLALGLPDTMFANKWKREKAARLLWFFLIGFVGTLGLFFLAWVLPQMGVYPIVTILMLMGLVVVVGWLVLRMAGGGMVLSDRHKLALISGALGFFILLAPLQELDKKRADNTAGMTIVGLLMAVFLTWVVLRLRRARQTSEQPENVE